MKQTNPKTLEQLYAGSDLGALFKGNFINFGFWHGIDFSKSITINDRIKSSQLLYDMVVNEAGINDSNSTRMLEAGCGHGGGVMPAHRLITLTLHTYLVKTILSLTLAWLSSSIVSQIKLRFGIDKFDYGVSYNPIKLNLWKDY